MFYKFKYKIKTYINGYLVLNENIDKIYEHTIELNRYEIDRSGSLTGMKELAISKLKNLYTNTEDVTYVIEIVSPIEDYGGH